MKNTFQAKARPQGSLPSTLRDLNFFLLHDTYFSNVLFLVGNSLDTFNECDR
jgi:hypothetical protein